MTTTRKKAKQRSFTGFHAKKNTHHKYTKTYTGQDKTARRHKTQAKLRKDRSKQKKNGQGFALSLNSRLFGVKRKKNDKVKGVTRNDLFSDE
jgi:hypothetical protein